MCRRKGEQTARVNERNFPHIIELPLPRGGWRDRTRETADFHERRSLTMHQGQARRDDGEFCVRLCFAKPADADVFQKRFGDERLSAGPEAAPSNSSALQHAGPMPVPESR